MDNQTGLTSPEPVIVADLFSEILDGLVTLLSDLDASDWEQSTACTGWSVKDVALHLLGIEIGNLSSRRDGHWLGASVNSWSELVTFVNDWNADWVRVARRISSPLLIDLLKVAGQQVNDYFRWLDPDQTGSAVSWAGPQPAPVWLDLAREYTERWHHQQHIRDATRRPGFKEPRYLAPVLATFVRALPRTFETILAAEGTVVTLTITGASGGRWSVKRVEDGWKLFSGTSTGPAAETILDEDTAWRLFTHGLTAEQARGQAILKGDPALGLQVLEMVSIIA